jgi:hypothetical protein
MLRSADVGEPSRSSDGTGRIVDDNGGRWDVLGDDRASADHAADADMDAGPGYDAGA